MRVLQALGLSDHLAALLPDLSVRPLERVRFHGRERQRAGRKSAVTPTAWTWGDTDAE